MLLEVGRQDLALQFTAPDLEDMINIVHFQNNIGVNLNVNPFRQ